MNSILQQIKKCQVCKEGLPSGCNPVVTAHRKSKIVIVGQAPGIKVHQSGIPWDDKSGENLRSWMGVNREQFYDTQLFAIIPMGFCYPGKAKNGDLPPRKECAPLWHPALFDMMSEVKMVLLVGLYAQKYYLKQAIGKNLTQTVMNYEQYLPYFFPLPHPSPLNNIWQSKNPWFKAKVLPALSEQVDAIVCKTDSCI
ncbi:uracil-DNA glycosylase family protein [Saccharicrinis fermentans]|uniref:Uracil-DNA glycosylase n=1 Tax=Saccharicrinis fermentans DSM 9555 = JCM 21142 TaxID=869213 RepID=W7YHK0_9BACT|nr:uracil-DNA glycosylase family protein [Saccharicrinis fermentans]GAF03931.1 uracil-DNA glycosylase [Saccharicrinis fermentans DSM 9555 = JCM 21142]